MSASDPRPLGLLTDNRSAQDRDKAGLAASGERFLPGRPSMQGLIEVEHLHRYLWAAHLVAGRRVLDVACGEGYGSAILAETAAQVVGVDVAPEIVALASQKYNRPNLKFVVGSAAKLPLAGASVDIVVSFETIEHHAQHEEMLQEIKRVLAPGGLLVMSSPDKAEYSDKRSYFNPYHVKELTKGQFERLIGRYFHAVTFLCQSSGVASMIVTSGAVSVDSIEPPQATPLYLIALASDGDLPAAPSAAFLPPLSAPLEDEARRIVVGARVYFQFSGDEAFAEVRSFEAQAVETNDGVAVNAPWAVPPGQHLIGLRVDPFSDAPAVRVRGLDVNDAAGDQIASARPRLSDTFVDLHLVRINEDGAADLLITGSDPQWYPREWFGDLHASATTVEVVVHFEPITAATLIAGTAALHAWCQALSSSSVLVDYLALSQQLRGLPWAFGTDESNRPEPERAVSASAHSPASAQDFSVTPQALRSMHAANAAALDGALEALVRCKKRWDAALECRTHLGELQTRIAGLEEDLRELRIARDRDFARYSTELSAEREAADRRVAAIEAVVEALGTERTLREAAHAAEIESRLAAERALDQLLAEQRAARAVAEASTRETAAQLQSLQEQLQNRARRFLERMLKSQT